MNRTAWSLSASRLLAIVALLAGWLPVARSQAAETKTPKMLAISGGKVVTVTQGVVNGGIVLVADGKIVDVVDPLEETDDGSDPGVDGGRIPGLVQKWRDPGDTMEEHPDPRQGAAGARRPSGAAEREAACRGRWGEGPPPPQKGWLGSRPVLPGFEPSRIPEGYEVIDARDRWVLPGFVDIHSHVGGSDLNDMVYPTNSGLRVIDNIMPNNPRLQKAQAGGVTTILFLPGSGTNLSGFAALMKTGGDTLEEVLIRFPGVLKVSQGGNPERRGGDLGLGSMGMNAILRHELEEGKRYCGIWDAYEKGERPVRPPFNPRLENYRKVFRREIPVLVHTQGSLLVEQTLRMFRDELDLWVIVGHGTFNGSELAPEVARKGVWVTNGPRQLRFDGDFGSVVGLARRWQEGGIREVCLNTDAGVVPQEELFYQAAMAVRLGLDEETALRAITIHGAKAVGIDDRVGSIEKGKDADLVLWTGNPLDPSSRVTLTIVNGKIVYDPRREPRRF